MTSSTPRDDLRTANDRSDASAMSVILWVAVAFALGQAIYANGGRYAANGMTWLAVAAVAAIFALFERRFRAAGVAAGRWLPYVLGAIIVFQLRQFVLVCPVEKDEVMTVWIQGVVLIGVLSGISLVRQDGRLVAGILVVFAAMAATVLWSHELPKIDVIEWQKLGCRALMQGENPYAHRMPDIYGPQFAHWYGPGMVKDGFVDTGYCYPPVCLLMALPGYLLGGIVYAQLAYMLLCVGLMWRLGGTRSTTIVAILAAWPPLMFVIAHGWTDIYVAPLMALTVYAALKRPTSWLLPIAMGLLFASKQHIFLITPLTLMLLPGRFSWRGWWNLLWRAAIVALAVTVPFVLWNPAAWWHSVVEFHLRSPFRTDALSFSGWVFNTWGKELSGILGFAAFSIYVAAALWLLPRKPPFFAAAAGGAYLFFFAWNKQAFANYYFFIAVCFLIAAASARIESETSPDTGH